MNIEERLLDQTSRWVALSEPDPLRLEAAAEIKRLRSSEECLKLAVAALVKNETELKAEIERLRAKNTTIEKEWTIAYTEVERLQSLLANSEMTVKELLANDERLTAALQQYEWPPWRDRDLRVENERLRAALREALAAWQEGRDINEKQILAALEEK